MLKEKIISK